MEKIIYRLIFILIIGVLSVVYVLPWNNFGIHIPFTAKDYKLGLDLSGGVELDYKVELDEVRQEENYSETREKSIIEGLKSIIDKRVESLNINDSVITSANYSGEKHIIVQIPLKGENREQDTENIRRAKEAIGKVVKIEFKELRNEVTDEDKKEREDIANSLLEDIKDSQYSFTLNTTRYKDKYENIEIGEKEDTIENFLNYAPLNGGILGAGLHQNVIKGTKWLDSEDQVYFVVNILEVKDTTIKFEYAMIDANPSEWMAAKDTKGRVLDDKYFVNSSVQYNQAFTPMVELVFSDEGGEIFGELTERLVGQPMAIFVGGELITAPTIQEKIPSGKAVITGDYTPEEAKKLSENINTGVVPAPIYLTSERTIDAKLGLGSLEKLLIAGVSGFIIIIIFLIAIYKQGGMMASIALLLYVTFLLSIVKLLGITLTLASVAGLILSIGIAIDANILIFERIKDELRRKIPTKKSVLIGFDKSWTAIWDANVTGIIISIILYIFGVNMIKGFGLMLGIGIIVSLFTAMFISRVLIYAIAKSGKIKTKCLVGYKD